MSDTETASRGKPRVGHPEADKPTPSERPVHVIEEADILTAAEEEKVRERLALPATAVYAIVKEEGLLELGRPTGSLFFSGVVAGLAMGFSVLSLALFEMYLPAGASWAPLVGSAGYSVGFLIVVLGRQQLFTESTLTGVLPLIATPSWGRLGQLGRVWGTVLAANWVGCLLAAVCFVVLPMVPPAVSAAVVAASQHYLELSAGEAFWRAIGAGFLVAVMVWMIPNAEANKFAIVAGMGWLIALGEFTHVVAGMCEVGVLVLTGDLGWVEGVVGLALPTLAGNVVGGRGVFAMLAWAQVREEVTGGGEDLGA